MYGSGEFIYNSSTKPLKKGRINSYFQVSKIKTDSLRIPWCNYCGFKGQINIAHGKRFWVESSYGTYSEFYICDVCAGNEWVKIKGIQTNE